MKVYTESGSMYLFNVFENSIRVNYRLREIIVTEVKNLELGKRMEIKGHFINFYSCESEEETAYITTSPIVRIEK